MALLYIRFLFAYAILTSTKEVVKEAAARGVQFQGTTPTSGWPTTRERSSLYTYLAK